MIFTKCTRFVLALIFLSLALKYSLVCAKKGVLMKGKFTAFIALQDHVSTQNDVGVEVSGLKGLSWRKMKIGHLLNKEHHGLQRPTLLGKDDSDTLFRGEASKCLKNQRRNKMYDKKEETETFSEEDYDVAHVMQKDYGNKPPHKKPPINNRNKPTD